MKKMITMNATEVRKDWGSFIDSIVREKPRFIKRSRDYVFAASVDMLKEMLKTYKLTANIYEEENSTVTASLEEIDIVASGASMEDALNSLAANLQEYAEEFYNDFEYWFSAPNRKPHLPYILNVLMQDDINDIRKMIICPVGKS